MAGNVDVIGPYLYRMAQGLAFGESRWISVGPDRRLREAAVSFTAWPDMPQVAGYTARVLTVTDINVTGTLNIPSTPHPHPIVVPGFDPDQWYVGATIKNNHALRVDAFSVTIGVIFSFLSPVPPPGEEAEDARAMRLTVYHDDRGDIAALIARPDGSPPAHIELRPGGNVTELQVADLTDDLDSGQLNERLSNILSSKRVLVPPAQLMDKT
jgi:hypothetical protein